MRHDTGQQLLTRQQLAVLGSPISHSKSPAIHTAAYQALGLPWDYGRVQCEIAELAEFLRNRDLSWRGLSLTMPLKEEAWRLATRHDISAELSGVVNTLVRHGDDWYGANTDIEGLAMALRAHSLDATRAVILGAGATAVSAILAARSCGATHIEVRARRAETAQALAERFDCSWGLLHETPANAPTLTISTLPGPAGASLQPSEVLTAAPLFDVAYDPWPSPLSEVWQARGGSALPGIDMLIFQALLQIRLFVHGDLEKPLPDEELVLAQMRTAAGHEHR